MAKGAEIKSVLQPSSYLEYASVVTFFFISLIPEGVPITFSLKIVTRILQLSHIFRALYC